MRESTKTAIAVVSVLAIAAAFWLLLLSPKREKASELAEQTSSLSAEVASEGQKAAEAVAATRNFPDLYRQMVVLGKAVPAESGTPSLLVQLNGVSSEANASFRSIVLAAEAGEGEVASPEGSTPLPIGAAVGQAGLPAMPYTIEFTGGFFQIADFIENLDKLVETKNGEVKGHGRLVMIDEFTLVPVLAEGVGPAGQLNASFKVTTYVAPPGEGLTAGATESGPSSITE